MFPLMLDMSSVVSVVSIIMVVLQLFSGDKAQYMNSYRGGGEIPHQNIDGDKPYWSHGT